ncbi:MAG: hypothetical protein E5Y74_26765 [Mesorhizobium sp.]|nr:MAG: hypothetical protein EOS73_14550 [Mesorhizobium sp.]TIM18330.1 MAG: hypothetical protein E5Y74_26765 [Mesorhizobium sp.]TIN72075.1 MAG: hypothetical protein E5Y30_08690 [Mesorhizobium sp.]
MNGACRFRFNLFVAIPKGKRCALFPGKPFHTFPEIAPKASPECNSRQFHGCHAVLALELSVFARM